MIRVVISGHQRWQSGASSGMQSRTQSRTPSGRPSETPPGDAISLQSRHPRRHPEMQSRHPRCNLTCRYQRSNWARSRPDASAIARRKSSQVTACPSWRLKYRSIALRKVGQPSKVRYIRITCAQCGHQWSSEVIRGHQRSSEVIRGHQWITSAPLLYTVTV